MGRLRLRLLFRAPTNKTQTIVCDRRPPPVSAFSPHYPGNDERYVQQVHDVPISPTQNLIRSLAHGRLELHHRQFPLTESLKDCMERTIPYFCDTIVPQSLDQGKNVLIASSENAIRGLLMHLCDIPKDQVSQIEIPTGVPMVFDFEHKRLHLLDDQLLPKPRERYNFGAGGAFLFNHHRSDARDGDAAADRADDDPHIYLTDEFVVDPTREELDRLDAASKEAHLRVEEFCGGMREPREPQSAR